MTHYKALQVEQGDRLEVKFVDKNLEPLKSKQVRIKIHYSSINYKDALGVTGKGKIFRTLPIVPGIDAAGVVAESKSSFFKPGQEVLITGCGFGESHDGGYSEFCQVDETWVVPIPPGLSLKESMILGTAGFTAGLCVYKLELNGQRKIEGPIAVTGASGGVGSLAINILSQRGYDVLGVSGKNDKKDYLMSLGASAIVHPSEFLDKTRPLESIRIGGAIDHVGGDVLKGLLTCTQLWGNIASVGLALGHEIHTSVMPFILRGVNLLGVSSTNCPYELRQEIWKQLATDYKPKHLDMIVREEINLSEIKSKFQELIDRKTSGRCIVNCQK